MSEGSAPVFEDERDEARASGSGVAPAGEPLLVLDRFRLAVEERPHATAVADGVTTLSFAELDRRVDAVARELVALGAGAETVAGVCVPKTVELLVAILGVLRAGAANLPLDPAYPPDRLAYMVRDSGAGLVVASGDVPSLPADLVRLDGRSSPSGAEPAGIHPDQCAYVIYTSGSTGRPKGVQVSHGALASFLAGVEQAGLVRAGAGRVGWNASPSFDASVQQWVRVCRGDTVVVLDDEVRRDPGGLARAVVANRLTDLDITPAHAEYVVPRLRRVLDGHTGLRLWVGGEGIKAPLWRRLAELADRGVLDAVNVYGTTETTVDTTAALVRGDTAPHLGVPLPGQTVRVLDPLLRPVPVGATGEIYVRGPSLARGYLGRPGLTATSFVPDPWAPDGARMYRTGDLASWTADGRLVFHGRADHQVKIRGYRVELGEIETVLAEHPEVLECVVVRRARGDGSLLDAYVCMARPGGIEQVRAHARAVLPEWMRPASYTSVAEMPRTPSGKLDREALAAHRNAG